MSFERINTLLDEHESNHKLYKKGISFKEAKHLINKIRERDMLFKRYCSASNKYKNVMKNKFTTLFLKYALKGLFAFGILDARFEPPLTKK